MQTHPSQPAGFGGAGAAPSVRREFRSQSETCPAGFGGGAAAPAITRHEPGRQPTGLEAVVVRQHSDGSLVRARQTQPDLTDTAGMGTGMISPSVVRHLSR